MNEILEIWAEHYQGLEMPNGHVRQQPFYRVGPRGKPAPTQDDIADRAEAALTQMIADGLKREVVALVYRFGYRLTGVIAAKKLGLSRTRYYELLKDSKAAFETRYVELSRQT